MRVMKRRGFTIVETMLFLAISAVLTVAILATTGVSISMQRYKDAVATLQSDIQQQYEDALSIKNSRQDGGATPSDCTGDRGQTGCILMGKLMTITHDGRMTQYVVYGREPEPPLSESITNEYQVMRAYNPRIVESSAQAKTMEWGTGISWPEFFPPGTPDPRYATNRDMGILIIRSPRSGIVYTFTKDNAVANAGTSFNAMIDATARGRRTICVAPSGWVVNDRMSVTIAANASSVGAVEVRTNQLTTELKC